MGRLGRFSSSWGHEERANWPKEFATSASSDKTCAGRSQQGGENSMAIHLTPTELGREAGMHRREVIAKCMELGVPIFQGRIDKTLFVSSLKQASQKKELANA